MRPISAHLTPSDSPVRALPKHARMNDASQIAPRSFPKAASASASVYTSDGFLKAAFEGIS